MGRVKEKDYELRNCISIEKPKYQAMLYTNRMLIYALITVCVVVIIFSSLIFKENRELKKKVQRYQDEIVYYKHNYEE